MRDRAAGVNPNSLANLLIVSPSGMTESWVYCRRIRDWPAYALMSDRITRSPGCSPSTTSIVFTDNRPNRTFTLVACIPSASILNRLASLFAAPNTGRPTYVTLGSLPMRMVPSTLSPDSSPWGRGAVSRTCTLTTPFKADESTRVTLPASMGFCLVSIETS